MADKKIMAGIIATLLASLCCITPVLAVVAGVGSMASSFAWMEPYHNYLAGLTVIILAYAWWDKLRAKKQDLDCACEDEDGKAPFLSSKKFLAVVTLFALVMLTFPQWGYTYFKVEEACITCVAPIENPVKTQEDTKVEKKASVTGAKALSNADLVKRYIDEEKKSPTVNFGGQACAGIGYVKADNLLYYAKQDIVEMPVAVLHKMLTNAEDIILLDVREADQRSEGEIYADESYAMTRGNLEFRIMNMIKDTNAIIVAYCRSGGRSVFAAQTLKKLGYSNAYSLKGGLKEWALSGFPYENGLGVVVKVEAE